MNRDKTRELLFRWKVPDTPPTETLLVITYGIRRGEALGGIGDKIIAFLKEHPQTSTVFLTEDVRSWLERQGQERRDLYWLPARLRGLAMHTFSPHQDTRAYFSQASMKMGTLGVDLNQVTIITHWSQMWRAAKCWERVSNQWPKATQSAWEPWDPGFPISHFISPLFWLGILKEETGSAIWHFRVPLLAFPWELGIRIYYSLKGYL